MNDVNFAESIDERTMAKNELLDELRNDAPLGKKVRDVAKKIARKQAKEIQATLQIVLNAVLIPGDRVKEQAAIDTIVENMSRLIKDEDKNPLVAVGNLACVKVAEGLVAQLTAVDGIGLCS